MDHPPVAVVKTSPETVHEDYRRLLEIAEADTVLERERETVLALDMPWHHHFPACSTAPWQLDGVIGALLDLGFDATRMRVCIHALPGVRADKGIVLNRLLQVCEKRGLPLDIPDSPSPVSSDDTTGKNLVLLPPMRTHAGAVMAGALFTAFSFFHGRRAGERFDDIAGNLADMPRMLADGAANVLAVADGACVGTGPGPRRLMFREENVLAASADPLALDMFIARRLGIDPGAAPYIVGARAKGFGPDGDIALIGDEPPKVQPESAIPLSQRGRILWNLESGGGAARELAFLHDDWFWYVTEGERRLKPFWKSAWGRVFESYRRDSRYEQTD